MVNYFYNFFIFRKNDIWILTANNNGKTFD